MGFARLDKMITAIKSALTQIVRVGTVSSVNEKNGTVRVQFGDADASAKPLISDELPVLTRKSLRDKTYWMPDVDEHVLCLFLPFGLRQGFVLGAFYSQADPVPAVDRDVMHVIFDDGSWFEYHRGEHKLSGHVVNGYADLTVDVDANITSGENLTARVGKNVALNVTEDLSINVGGNIDITAAGTVRINGSTIHLNE